MLLLQDKEGPNDYSSSGFKENGQAEEELEAPGFTGVVMFNWIRFGIPGASQIICTRAIYCRLFQWPRAMRPSSLEDMKILSGSLFGS